MATKTKKQPATLNTATELDQFKFTLRDNSISVACTQCDYRMFVDRAKFPLMRAAAIAFANKHRNEGCKSPSTESPFKNPFGFDEFLKDARASEANRE